METRHRRRIVGPIDLITFCYNPYGAKSREEESERDSDQKHVQVTVHLCTVLPYDVKLP